MAVFSMRRAQRSACWLLSILACLPTLPYALIVMALGGRARRRRARRVHR